MKFYNILSDGKKSALIGGILILVLFSVMFSVAEKRKEKLESDFVWTEATITDIELNVSKSTITRKHVFHFEYNHNGKKYKKVSQVYRPELLTIGQKFKLKVHRTDPELVAYELKASYSLLTNPDSYRDSRIFYLPAGRQVRFVFAKLVA